MSRTPRTAAWVGDERCIYLTIRKQPGSNVVQVVDEIKALLPAIREQLPASVSLDVRSDRSGPIRESVHDVKLTLVLSIVLVVVVIFLFLRSISATVIASLALPASLVATFTVMYLLDYSLDNLSLMALTLSVGFVVDDAIVMLENIVRHMEMGKSALQASLDAIEGDRLHDPVDDRVAGGRVHPGAVHGRDRGPPAARVRGHDRRGDPRVGLVSISLTPMLCSRFLKPLRCRRARRDVSSGPSGCSTAWQRVYDRTLSMALRHGAVMMAMSVVLVGGTAYLFTLVPKGFLPSEDQGRFVVNTEGMQGISFDAMVRHQLEFNDVLLADPNVSAVSANVGLGGSRRRQYRPHVRGAQAAIGAQSVSGPDHRGACGRSCHRFPALRVFMTNPPPINLGGQNGGRATYQFTLQHTDTTELYRWAQVAEDKLRQMPGSKT